MLSLENSARHHIMEKVMTLKELSDKNPTLIHQILEKKMIAACL